MKEGIVLIEKMAIYLRIPTRNMLIKLKCELEDWEPSEGAQFDLLFERLNDYFALILRTLFLSDYVDGLAGKKVSFVFQFNQISPNALMFFFKEAKRKFPEKMHFVCPSEEMLQAWVGALAYAVVKNRLSAHTRFDLSAGGPLSPKQQEILQKALSFSTAPNHLMITYQGMSGNLAELNSMVFKLGGVADDTSFLRLIEALQVVPAALQCVSSNAVAVTPMNFVPPAAMKPGVPLIARPRTYREDVSVRKQSLFSVAEDNLDSDNDEEEKKEHEY